ncbi:MAG TPA: tryptophan synthase subunit alpha [Euzebyales bacterium]|nr:tryptophan synthase subunit alpha [Euzebyales bacterium]
MSRVSDAIRKANADGRAALIVYLPAGFPDMDTSRACLEAAAAAGADLLEVGFPYSDPLMDGPTIQQANQVALDAGYTPVDDLEMCTRLTAAVDVPALVMTYYNICWHYGAPAGLTVFARAAADAGLAGVIIPDLPVVESGDWLRAAAAVDLASVFLVASTSDDDHLAAAARVSNGFIYATSTLGVTGTRTSLSQRAQPLVERLRRVTGRPVCVGIGVSTAEQAEAVAGFADGVIVGSAAVRAVADDGPAAVGRLVGELADGCRRGYRVAGTSPDKAR